MSYSSGVGTSLHRRNLIDSMQSIPAELQLMGDTRTGRPLVPAGTPLSELTELLDTCGQRHLLVVQDQILVGVVALDDVQRRLTCANPVERRRWASAPVENLLSTPLAHRDSAPARGTERRSFPQSIECLSHIIGDRVVAVSTADDVFLSWTQLQPILDHASTDPVTHLPRRSHFERTLAREVERAARDASPLAVILIDIDHFKRINDLCGHALGDAVLHLVGRCLRRSLRSDDVAARYGGDEFVAICPGCHPEMLALPIRRIQESIRQLCVPGDAAGLRISLSIGAVVGPCLEPGITAESLIALADRCLYASKRGGRNCAHEMVLGDAPLAPSRMSLAADMSPETMAAVDAASTAVGLP
jgi:diguanylate cyclase (GGDEF)-like protein